MICSLPAVFSKWRKKNWPSSVRPPIILSGWTAYIHIYIYRSFFLIWVEAHNNSALKRSTHVWWLVCLNGMLSRLATSYMINDWEYGWKKWWKREREQERVRNDRIEIDFISDVHASSVIAFGSDFCFVFQNSFK